MNTIREIGTMTQDEQRFASGQIVMTRAVAGTEFNPMELLRRHLSGDWGDVCEEDAALNEQGLKNGERLMSVYKDVGLDEPIWIITEWDRSVTTVLFPSDY